MFLLFSLFFPNTVPFSVYFCAYRILEGNVIIISLKLGGDIGMHMGRDTETQCGHAVEDMMEVVLLG